MSVDGPTRPPIPAKEIVGDHRRFEDFARRLIGVPHEEIKSKLEAERSAKRLTKRRASRASASSSKVR